jgi:glycosyltransferase involved in cell wall biosynthesis
MLEFSFRPIVDDVANPTARLRFHTIVRALRERDVSAELFEPGRLSEQLVWGARDPGIDIDALRRLHRRIVFDLTDNILDSRHAPWSPAWWLDRPGRHVRRRRIRRFLARFDALIVGSVWLADRVRQEYPGPVFVIEDAQDPLPQIPTSPSTRQLVWIGMDNNLRYLFEVFGRAKALSHFDLKVITSRARRARYRGTRSNEELASRLPFRTTFVEWSLESYQRELAQCAIALAPLPQNPVTLAKTENKLLLYSALGLPFVASGIPSYRRFVEDHGLGLLATDPDDWARCLAQLLDDALQRRAIAQKGPEIVARYFGTGALVEKYLEVHRTLLPGRYEETRRGQP